jgi:hypothetical protein
LVRLMSTETKSLSEFLSWAKQWDSSDTEVWDIAREVYPKWKVENAWTARGALIETATMPSSMGTRIKWVRQVRRGSDLYCGLVIKKFSPLLEAARADPSAFSPATFVTLTSNPNAMTREESIDSIQKAWNILLTTIRKRHPEIDFLKVIELTPKQALVHLHVLFFNCPYIPKEWLSKTWERLHSAPIVDIEMVRNLEHSILYLLKHQRKIMKDDDAMSYFWFHRKRAWTTSRHLWELVSQVLAVDLTKAKIIQTGETALFEFRLGTVIFEEGKDPPAAVDIPLTSEEMAFIRSAGSFEHTLLAYAMVVEGQLKREFGIEVKL